MDCERQPIILVSGAARPRPEDISAAEEVGRLLAAAGSIVLTGGGTGVMEAASRGARAAGGTTLAVLPGSSARESPPNPEVLIPVYSGMGNGRNAILVRSAEAVIAIGGGWGTLSEIALARNLDRPVVLLGSWRISPPDPTLGPMPVQARDAKEAVERALRAVRNA
ncbi:MAG: hypothetical protein FJY88_11900 [Candidatus Eisenbacteria bacterium]|nr:hypothetical protein [Candidatus Eisenbacteria bacterium]